VEAGELFPPVGVPLLGVGSSVEPSQAVIVNTSAAAARIASNFLSFIFSLLLIAYLMYFFIAEHVLLCLNVILAQDFRNEKQECVRIS
jgi:hypothetical protein